MVCVTECSVNATSRGQTRHNLMKIAFLKSSCLSLRYYAVITHILGSLIMPRIKRTCRKTGRVQGAMQVVFNTRSKMEALDSVSSVAENDMLLAACCLSSCSRTLSK